MDATLTAMHREKSRWSLPSTFSSQQEVNTSQFSLQQIHLHDFVVERNKFRATNHKTQRWIQNCFLWFPDKWFFLTDR
jgi:hypothetical protein